MQREEANFSALHTRRTEVITGRHECVTGVSERAVHRDFSRIPAHPVRRHRDTPLQVTSARVNVKPASPGRAVLSPGPVRSEDPDVRERRGSG